LETFPEFASSPTLRILSATLFNQNQKFFVARRPQQRRLSDATPFHASDFRNELFQLFQHTRVNGWVSDHALAAVSFFFAGLELRFDERDDVTQGLHQCNRRWQNLAQRDERTIDDDQIRERKIFWKLRRSERARIRLLHYDDARIV